MRLENIDSFRWVTEVSRDRLARDPEGTIRDVQEHSRQLLMNVREHVRNDHKQVTTRGQKSRRNIPA